MVKPGMVRSILRVGVGTATAVVLVAVLLTYSAVSYWHLRNISTIQATARESTAALDAASRLFSALQDAETGQRGYLLTTLPEYLAPYESALGTVKQMRGALGEALRKEPAQAERLAELDQHIDAKLAEMAELLQIADQQGFEIARQRWPKIVARTRWTPFAIKSRPSSDWPRRGAKRCVTRWTSVSVTPWCRC